MPESVKWMKAQELRRRGGQLLEEGGFPQAELSLLSALELARQLPPTPELSRFIFDTQLELTYTYHNLDFHKKTEVLAKQLMQSLTPEDSRYALLKSYLAEISFHRLEYAKALEEIQECIPLFEKHFGEDARTAVVLNNASIFQIALLTHLKALEIKEAEDSEDLEKIASIDRDLDKKKLAEAQQNVEKALRLITKDLGPEHDFFHPLITNINSILREIHYKRPQKQLDDFGQPIEGSDVEQPQAFPVFTTEKTTEYKEMEALGEQEMPKYTDHFKEELECLEEWKKVPLKPLDPPGLLIGPHLLEIQKRAFTEVMKSKGFEVDWWNARFIRTKKV